MKPGPKPKPYELKAAEGFRGHRRHRPAVSPLADDFRAPVRLSKIAQREWKRIRGIAFWLRPTDAGALAERCRIFARLEQAEKDVDARGLLVPGRAGELVTNPAARISRGLRDQLMRLDSALGLTPTSRAGIPDEQTPAYDAIEAALCGDLPPVQGGRKWQ